MSEKLNQPREYDAVLGGQNSPPIHGLVLGGIEGIRQRFNNGNTAQKIEALANLLNYQDVGIELLIEALSEPVLAVRATAGNYLHKIDNERAKLAIANGIIINQGDRIYSVYESRIAYNDWCYDLCASVEDIEESDYGKPTPISRHVFKESAEATALLHHNWRAFQNDVCDYFNQIGWNESDGLRGSLNIVEWCKNNHVLIRLPGETRANFEQRIDIGDSAKLKLLEAHQMIYEEWLREESYVEVDWCVLQELEQRIIKSLQASQRYELLGQLWLECVGKLAFVHEEVVNQQTYIQVTGIL